MFGYVRPVRNNLTEQQKADYQAVYCGLCDVMGRRFGLAARMTLSYDFVFLAMLLSPGKDGMDHAKRRCPAHPLRRKNCMYCLSGMDLAADESMILVWHKLMDDIADKSLPRSIPSRTAALFLRKAYRQAACRCPDFDRETAECLKNLGVLERENSPSMDRAADTFARILRAAAPASGEESARQRATAQILYHVGRWIYLVDAWDDLKEDRADGRYNPLDARFDGRAEENLDYLKTTMTHSLNMARSAFELEQFGPWQPILSNILYFGLPTVQEAVLSGRWKEIRKGKEYKTA